MKTQPVVLLVTASEWFSTARLSMALASLGARVELMSPAKHPALLTSAVSRQHAYSPFRPLTSLRSAIETAKPAAIIAADEVTVLQLEELLAQEAEGSPLRALLLRSIGGPEVFAAARSRMTLLRTAQAQGAAIPETVTVEAPQDLAKAIAQLGLPLVMKADATSGGRGVRVLSEAAEAEATWRWLHQAPGFGRAMWRGLKHKDWTHIRAWKNKLERGVTAQKFVTGKERTAMAACHEGTVLALVCFEAMKTWTLRGPSSVLRVVRDEAMERAVAGVAGALKVSGFCGFDFMVADGSATPMMIEMNPRPTQVVHLALGPGRDLVAAYLRHVAGMSAATDRPAATQGDVIALFPQELQRDAHSELLATAYHDVPWSEPGLVERALSPLPQVITSDERWLKQPTTNS